MFQALNSLDHQAVMNHEKVVTGLAQALTKIGDALPQVELSAVMYPTDRMKTAVAELYANIIKFLVRARDWYEEGKIMHFIHSITRPWELRYDDILEAVTRKAQVVKDLAVSGQQAESRDTNQKRDAEYKDINRKLEKISTAMARKYLSESHCALISELDSKLTKTVQSAAMVDTNYRLSDLQFSQIMASLSKVPLMDPLKVYQYHYTLHRRRRLQTSGHSLSNRFWHSPKLLNWTKSSESEISIIMGNFHSRLALRGFCVDVVEQLREHQVPVLLSLRVAEDLSATTKISSIDLLMYFVKQALQISQETQTERSMSLSCARFHSAMSETEAKWFQVLESVLAEIGRLVYIIVDLEVLDSDLGTLDGFSWFSAFLAFFETLKERLAETKVKVLLISYGSRLPFSLSDSEYSDFVVPVKTTLTTVRQRRAGRPLLAEAKNSLLGNLRGQTNMRLTPRRLKRQGGPG